MCVLLAHMTQICTFIRALSHAIGTQRTPMRSSAILACCHQEEECKCSPNYIAVSVQL